MKMILFATNLHKGTLCALAVLWPPFFQFAKQGLNVLRERVRNEFAGSEFCRYCLLLGEY